MLSGLQVLRGIAALFVVFFHIHIWGLNTFHESAITGTFFMAGEYGVDLFFVISGFVMVFITKTPLSSLRKYLEFLYLRVTRIYPPYLIITILLTFVWLVKPGMFNSAYGNKVDILRSYFLLPQESVPLVGVGWTLIHEQWFYFVVSLALIFNAKGRLVFGVLWFATVTAVFLHGLPSDGPFFKLIFSPFSLTFILGYFLGLSFVFIKNRGSVGAGCLLLLVACICYGFGAAQIGFSGLYPNNNNILRFLYVGVPCAMITGAFLMLEPFFHGRWKAMTRLGDASYSLYLVHVPIVALLHKLPPFLGNTGSSMAWVFAILTMIVCVAVALVFHACVELPILNFAKRYRAVLFNPTPRPYPEHP